eukprot:CAMPEP_0183379136 /NCGR_PEP_ID=MMETSP0164_2-20130417/125274_1 /TAXON_ID=221442 /ORGANISM="Coccolithus pelagicus ssp braarudi, Strain PLY182g" /LENGTH=297 /DNA_ID=CAMNT_0025556713 /DNA_START=304 /DNA_END=1197 /DNA_ORIENTATION=+
MMGDRRLDRRTSVARASEKRPSEPKPRSLAGRCVVHDAATTAYTRQLGARQKSGSTSRRSYSILHGSRCPQPSDCSILPDPVVHISTAGSSSTSPFCDAPYTVTAGRRSRRHRSTASPMRRRERKTLPGHREDAMSMLSTRMVSKGATFLSLLLESRCVRTSGNWLLIACRASAAHTPQPANSVYSTTTFTRRCWSVSNLEVFMAGANGIIAADTPAGSVATITSASGQRLQHARACSRHVCMSACVHSCESIQRRDAWVAAHCVAFYRGGLYYTAPQSSEKPRAACSSSFVPALHA